MNLLLVEDNPGDVGLVREAVREFVQQGTLQFSVVHTGSDAFAFLRRHAPYQYAVSPDLVLLDLNLPGISGYEVLAELKHDPQLHFVPVVVFTTTSGEPEINRCYELGANAYLVKPIDLAQFLDLVKLTVRFWSACKFRLLVSEGEG
jgi:two-component system, chemotaxis family, response regulator Rcp1